MVLSPLHGGQHRQVPASLSAAGIRRQGDALRRPLPQVQRPVSFKPIPANFVANEMKERFFVAQESSTMRSGEHHSPPPFVLRSAYTISKGIGAAT